jgi:hypothetical protein
MGKMPRHKQLEDLEKKGHVRSYKLRSIVDGSEQTFWDEGPFETNPDFTKIDPSIGRQTLIRTLRKVDGETGLPIWFADSPGQKPVFDKGSGQFIQIPVLDQAILERLAQNLNARATADGTGRMILAQTKKALETTMQAQANAIVGSVAKVSTQADMLTKQNAGAGAGPIAPAGVGVPVEPGVVANVIGKAAAADGGA